MGQRLSGLAEVLAGGQAAHHERPDPRKEVSVCVSDSEVDRMSVQV